MGRYLGPVCKLCRREGVQLFLKGSRCLSPKCAVVKRKTPPGIRPKRMPKASEYKIQLREKQKIKRYYGLLEKQFRLTFVKANKMAGKPGENLLNLLERRLDNVIFISNLASSKVQSRQLIRHGHIRVNGKKVNIPSYILNAGDEIAVAEKSKNITFIRESLANLSKTGSPNWLEIDKDNLKAKVLMMPERTDVLQPFNEQLVVELYSK